MVLYLTRVLRFAASVRITAAPNEDRTRIWPTKPGDADAALPMARVQAAAGVSA